MPAILTFLKLNWKSILPGVLVLLALGYHFITVKSLNKKHDKMVAEYEIIITDLKSNNMVLLNENISLDNNIKSLNMTIEALNRSIVVNNEAIEKMKVDEVALKQEIEKWKNQKPEKVIEYVDKIVYVKDKPNATLEDYKRVNRNIAKIKYKDL